MPIGKPGKVLLTNVPLKFVAKKVGGGGHKALDASIPLVPFIDFLITLVVFLLTSFGGQELSVPAGMRMPDAHNVEELAELDIIAITTDVVTFRGLRVAETHALASDPRVERIEALVQNMETIKRNWAALRPGQPFDGRIIVQADVNTDFRVLKKVLFSATQAGYSNISFAVNRTGGS